jgi:hypothetical protein
MKEDLLFYIVGVYKPICVTPLRDSPGPVRSHPELPPDGPDPTQEHRVICWTAICLNVRGGALANGTAGSNVLVSICRGHLH